MAFNMRFSIPQLLSLILCFTLFYLPRVNIVQASETIYIKADGSVSPSTAPITREGNIYVFTADITNNSIVIEKSNVEIDGAEHTLQGTGVYNGSGFYLENVRGVTIKRVKICKFYWGVQMHLCSNCAILENEISTNSYGITPSWSNNSIIARNKVINNKGGGIYLVNSFDFLVAGNVVTSNDFFGIRLTSSSNCTIVENVVANSKGVWIYMVLSNNNIIYHNNFIEHNAHAFSSRSINVWDNGFPSGGNYWGDYNGTDATRDGIGETWYEIDENNKDRHPLTGMFSRFNTSLDYCINVISNFSIEDFNYFKSNNTIRMNLFNVTADQASGFSRLCIPKILFSPPYTVTFDNGLTEVLNINDTIYDNSAHVWIYLAYAHSTCEVSIQGCSPQAEPFPIWVVYAIVATAGAGAILLVYFTKIKKQPRKSNNHSSVSVSINHAILHDSNISIHHNSQKKTC